MARKIFVSYKHDDKSVAPLNGGKTARAYVDEIIELFEGDEIYKGEGDEDLSDFKDETIESHLRDKIYDSSMTIVLISPDMKDRFENESDQWIPWEISYSLKEISRQGRTSHTNAMLAVVLPDQLNAYLYFLEEDTCASCHCRTLCTDRLFQILRDNMFNIKHPRFNNCSWHTPKTVYLGLPSYIYSVKWCDFIKGKETYLETADYIRNDIDKYEITKTVNA